MLLRREKRGECSSVHQSHIITIHITERMENVAGISATVASPEVSLISGLELCTCWTFASPQPPHWANGIWNLKPHAACGASWSSQIKWPPMRLHMQACMCNVSPADMILQRSGQRCALPRWYASQLQAPCAIWSYGYACCAATQRIWHLPHKCDTQSSRQGIIKREFMFIKWVNKWIWWRLNIITSASPAEIFWSQTVF